MIWPVSEKSYVDTCGGVCGRKGCGRGTACGRPTKENGFTVSPMLVTAVRLSTVSSLLLACIHIVPSGLHSYSKLGTALWLRDGYYCFCSAVRWLSNLLLSPAHMTPLNIKLLYKSILHISAWYLTAPLTHHAQTRVLEFPYLSFKTTALFNHPLMW